MKKTLTLLIFLFAFPISVFSQISTNGVGVVSFSPNMANVMVGLTTRNDNLTVAISENTQIVQNTIEALREIGINSENLHTSEFNVFETNEQNEEGMWLPTQAVSSTLSITITNLEILNEVIEVAVENGMTNIWGITFDNTNRDDYYNIALTRAVQDGIEKANVIANALNKEIGILVSITENASFGFATNRQSAWATPLAEQTADVEIVAPQSLGVSANVTIVFDLNRE
ncbi:MAG: SIMPL domain-containing protein [Defluviitaleaceae bacterium]|nr:SIMPL domain-containing protein [Defluviitaleaceae bacterium]